MVVKRPRRIHRIPYWHHADPAGTWRSAGLGLVSNTAFLTQSQDISRKRYLFDAAAKS